MTVQLAAVEKTWTRGNQTPHAEYLSKALGHRFSIVAPGDFVATHKITEAVALGAAGGPLPVFVLPKGTGVAAMLPYTRWLDYCQLGYVVSEQTVLSGGMAAVLRKLEGVGEEEAAQKYAHLRLVRDAFVFRANSSVVRPSAAEYIIDETCTAARRFSATKGSNARSLQDSSTAKALGTSLLSRCGLS
eukprot:CAMPEP_0183374166 /NCGR_PEP_ID=MMETSP0164_2-20130417/113678_1 /TAXON_ID=221442 /ORGANISM="Coccolithus pelagicus ssp braarudi, Strain PLY182g" /LENGTH=187 /DNA_ID=CAMNT_0025551167 /DNA_START=206 /DNA_END=769 /DNA_ORIENTATION=-